MLKRILEAIKGQNERAEKSESAQAEALKVRDEVVAENDKLKRDLVNARESAGKLSQENSTLKAENSRLTTELANSVPAIKSLKDELAKMKAERDQIAAALGVQDDPPPADPKAKS